MKQTFGSMPTTMPKGYFKAVRFPVLALLDKPTGDHRLLVGEGGTVRQLPASIRYQPAASYGHEGAIPSGALFEVTIDSDTGEFSGRGFLLDDEVGRKHARMIHLQAQDRNSVDLADVKARFEEDLESGEYWIRFTKWGLAATTGVGTPAFAEAYAEVDPLTDEELMASFGDPMEELVASVVPSEVRVAGAPEAVVEIVADGAIRFPHEAFFVPEADKPQKIVVTAEGRIYGHLALWNTCHDGLPGCVFVPRPTDGYTSFNQAGPLTDKGQVQTGPIFLLGGHRKAASAPTLEQAYGGIENAWGDVRVIEGQFGPWISGVVRPGISEEMAHAARCSRISGHWLGGRLKAIVSCNVEGYTVPGDGGPDFSADFSFSTAEGELELVASFPGCMETAAGDGQQMTLTLNFTIGEDPDVVAAAVKAALGAEVPKVEEEDVAAHATEDHSMLVALLLEEDDL